MKLINYLTLLLLLIYMIEAQDILPMGRSTNCTNTDLRNFAVSISSIDLGGLNCGDVLNTDSETGAITITRTVEITINLVEEVSTQDRIACSSSSDPTNNFFFLDNQGVLRKFGDCSGETRLTVVANTFSQPIQQVYDNTFHNMTAFTRLFIEDQALQEVNFLDYSEMPSLSALYLIKNSITEIPAINFAEKFPRLVRMHMYSNALSNFPDNLFANMSHMGRMQDLQLQLNNFGELPRNLISTPFNLTIIGPFDGTLNLAHNRLTRIEPGTFANYSGRLKLDGNLFTSIPTGVFNSSINPGRVFVLEVPFMDELKCCELYGIEEMSANQNFSVANYTCTQDNGDIITTNSTTPISDSFCCGEDKFFNQALSGCDECSILPQCNPDMSTERCDSRGFFECTQCMSGYVLNENSRTCDPCSVEENCALSEEFCSSDRNFTAGCLRCEEGFQLTADQRCTACFENPGAACRLFNTSSCIVNTTEYKCLECIEGSIELTEEGRCQAITNTPTSNSRIMIIALSVGIPLLIIVVILICAAVYYNKEKKKNEKKKFGGLTASEFAMQGQVKIQLQSDMEYSNSTNFGSQTPLTEAGETGTMYENPQDFAKTSPQIDGTNEYRTLEGDLPSSSVTAPRRNTEFVSLFSDDLFPDDGGATTSEEMPGVEYTDVTMSPSQQPLDTEYTDVVTTKNTNGNTNGVEVDGEYNSVCHTNEQYEKQEVVEEYLSIS